MQVMVSEVVEALSLAEDDADCLRLAGTVGEDEEGVGAGREFEKAAVSPSKPSAASVASLGISSSRGGRGRRLGGRRRRSRGEVQRTEGNGGERESSKIRSGRVPNQSHKSQTDVNSALRCAPLSHRPPSLPHRLPVLAQRRILCSPFCRSHRTRPAYLFSQPLRLAWV